MKRGGPLTRYAPLKRTPLRATPSKRSWTAALEKVASEGKCRACGRADVKLDAAHLVPRSQVPPGIGEDPRNIVPLCAGPIGCHIRYDGHALELLGVLTLDEQSYITGLVGIARAYRITTHRDQAALAACGANRA